MKLKGIIVSGYFNPLHKGHIEYFTKSKQLGDKLFVIINNDNQRILKGSKEFMLEDERMIIVESLSLVDYTFLSIDQDSTVCKTIEYIYNKFNSNYIFSFAKILLLSDLFFMLQNRMMRMTWKVARI